MTVTAALLTRRKLVGFAIETDSGTAASVTTAMAATSVKDIKCVPMGVYDNTKRTPAGLYSGSVAAPPGKRLGKLTFKQELRPGDQFVQLLKVCRFAADGSTYNSVSSLEGRNTGTFKVWEGGRVKSIVGAVGNCKLTFTTGGIVEADWEFMGIWVPPIDEAMPSQSNLNTLPFVATNLQLTVNETALPYVSSVTIDLGNNIEEREDITSDPGAVHYVVSDWNTMIDLDPEARLIASHDAYGLFLAGTTAELQIVITSNANTLTFYMPKIQRVEIDDAERGKRLVDSIKCQALVNNGDDELIIVEYLD